MHDKEHRANQQREVNQSSGDMKDRPTEYPYEQRDDEKHEKHGASEFRDLLGPMRPANIPCSDVDLERFSSHEAHDVAGKTHILAAPRERSPRTLAFRDKRNSKRRYGYRNEEQVLCDSTLGRVANEAQHEE
jgi:hypothetical protein